jgi:hypothetical protein
MIVSRRANHCADLLGAVQTRNYVRDGEGVFTPTAPFRRQLGERQARETSRGSGRAYAHGFRRTAEGDGQWHDNARIVCIPVRAPGTFGMLEYCHKTNQMSMKVKFRPGI